MIKKNTKIIFEDEKGQEAEELTGGMPLSKGETVHIHKDGADKPASYEVTEKTIDVFYKDKDQIVYTTYILRKK